MSQAQFKNVAKCAIGERAPGEEFFLDTFPEEPTTPKELFWRKRIADQSVQLVVPPAPAEGGKKAKG